MVLSDEFDAAARLDGGIRAMVVFDDGTGPALYVGGTFATAGDLELNGIAKWDGTTWRPVGAGVSGSYRDMHGGVHALAVFDDGGGKALYVAGDFTSAGNVPAGRVARWDGAAWSPIGVGADDTVDALAVYDDGNGEALHAAGFFRTATGVRSLCVARWDGKSWSALGGEIHSPVHALAVYDDGNGPALYAGGSFHWAPLVSPEVGPSDPLIVAGIMRWDGERWLPVGGGVKRMYGMPSSVNAMTVLDDGFGPTLVVGGHFSAAGGVETSLVAKWDGKSWSPLGSGLSPEEGRPGSVDALALVDAGSGSTLYAGGAFAKAGEVPVDGLARWDGESWGPVGAGCGFHVRAVAALHTARGTAIYAGGDATMSGGVQVDGVARWDGKVWTALGSGIKSADDEPGHVKALDVLDDGAGPALFAGGSFAKAGSVAANSIARWDGTSWSALGSGIRQNGDRPGDVHALAVFDDGGGPALYVGGRFTEAGAVVARNIAKWDGKEWRSVVSGVGAGTQSLPTVDALTVFDDGDGPALYAGGRFETPGDVRAGHLAKWDGRNWTLFESEMADNVTALAVLRDQTGTALYAAGYFRTRDRTSGCTVGRWDGQEWTPLCRGLDERSLGYLPQAFALTTRDDGYGEALYMGGGVGGYHHDGSDDPPHIVGIAKWTGQEWLPLGGALGGDSRWANPFVLALTVFDDGTGPALFAGGSFTSVDGLVVNRIAKWNGAKWSPLGNGVRGEHDPTVRELTVFDDGGGAALFAGGGFARVNALPANNISAWLRSQAGR